MGKKFFTGICIVLVVLILSIFGWSYIHLSKAEDTATGLAADPSAFTKTDSQGPVAISVQWLNPEDLNADSLQLNLSMNTHSVNLDEFDVAKNSEVYIDNQIITSGLEVEKQGSGHHVSTLLKVPVKKSGIVINMKQAKTIKLVVKDLGNIPQRVLVWNVN